MKSVIIHIFDEILIIKINNQITKLNTSILNGRINDEKKFIQDLQKFNRDNKINHTLFGESLKVIVNDYYTQQDEKYLIEIFKELEFSKVEIFKESSLIDEESVEIIIDSSTVRIFTSIPLIISTLLFLKYHETILSNLLGTNKKSLNIHVADLFNNLEKDLKESYFLYTNPLTILVNKIM